MNFEQVFSDFIITHLTPVLRKIIREEFQKLPHLREGNKPHEEYLTATESAEFIGDALQTFYGRTSRGEIKTYGGGKKIRCKKSDLIAWLGKKRTKSKLDLDEEVNDYLTNKSRKGRSLKIKSK